MDRQADGWMKQYDFYVNILHKHLSAGLPVGEGVGAITLMFRTISSLWRLILSKKKNIGSWETDFALLCYCTVHPYC